MRIGCCSRLQFFSQITCPPYGEAARLDIRLFTSFGLQGAPQAVSINGRSTTGSQYQW